MGRRGMESRGCSSRCTFLLTHSDMGSSTWSMFSDRRRRRGRVAFGGTYVFSHGVTWKCTVVILPFGGEGRVSSTRMHEGPEGVTPDSRTSRVSPKDSGIDSIIIEGTTAMAAGVETSDRVASDEGRWKEGWVPLGSSLEYILEDADGYLVN